MRYFIILALILAIASPAFAGVQPCSAQMVTAGFCRVETNRILFFDMPTADLVKLRDAICNQYGYQDEIDGAPNPQPCGQFAQAWLKTLFNNLQVNETARQAGDAARQEAATDPSNQIDVGDDGSG